MKNLYLSSIFILACAGISFAQTPVLLPSYGHTAFATDFDIDVTSKSIASVGIDGKMIFWDIDAQRAYKSVAAHTAESYSIRYSWNGKYIITSSVDKTVKVWDATGELLKTIETGSSNLFAEFNRAETQFVVASSDGHARLYSYPECKLLVDMKGKESKLNFAVFSTNGNVVFTGDDAGNYMAYDVTKEGKVLQDSKMESAVKMITFDWAGSAMMFHTMDGMGEIILMASFTSLGRIPLPTVDYKSGAAQFCGQMDISPDSRWLAWPNDKFQVQIVSGETLVNASKTGEQFLTTAIPLPHTDFVSKVKFSPDMRYLVTLGHDRQMMVLEIQGVDLEKREDNFISVNIIKQYSDQIRSIYFDRENEIHARGFFAYSFDLKDGDHNTEHIVDARESFLRDELTHFKYEGLDLYVDAKRDMVFIDENNRLTDPDEIIWSNDRSVGSILYGKKVYVLDMNKNIGLANYNAPWKTKPDIFALSNDGFLYTAMAKEIRAYDLKGKSSWEHNASDGITDLAVSNDNLVLAIGNYGEKIPILDAKSGKEKSSIYTAEAEAEHIAFLSDNKTFVYTGFYGNLYKGSIDKSQSEKIIDNKNINGFEIATSFDDRMVGVIGYDRVVRLFDLQEKEEVFRMYNMKENGMAVVNESNYYLSDKKAYKELAFYFKGEIYQGDQFDAYYNRPDKVLAESPYSDPEYVKLLTSVCDKRMKKMGMTSSTPDQVSAMIEISNQKEIPKNTSEKSMKFNLLLKDSVNIAEKIFVSVNDVPIYGKSGKKLEKASNGTIAIEVEVPLVADKNVIKFSTMDANGNMSLAKNAELICHNTEKPNLYLVTIGTSEYQDTRFQLDYPVKDAEDLTALFKSNRSSYNKINTFALKDKEVKKESLEKVKSFLKDANPQDVVMVFIAGHGLLDAEMNYFLATYDTDFLDPSKRGIAYSEIDKIMEGVSALRKTVVMDACHSGELDKEDVMLAANTSVEKKDNVKFRSSGSGVLEKTKGALQTSALVKELFADMRASSGATVMSSASGAEYAMELGEFKNGLFTYCFLDGIKNMEADLNGDGEIFLSELQQYVSKKVTELSKGKQQPTSRTENLSMDFRVW